MTTFRDQIKTGLVGLRSLTGEPITYRRGGASVEIDYATPIGAENAEDESTRTVVVGDEMTFRFAASALVMAGRVAKPLAGDIIEHTRDGVKTQWQVHARNDGQPWDWHGKFSQTQIDVFTKKVKVF